MILAFYHAKKYVQRFHPAFPMSFGKWLTAFNGADHQEDPRDKGWIGGDAEYTSLAGQILIADIFRRLGYEFIVP